MFFKIDDHQKSLCKKLFYKSCSKIKFFGSGQNSPQRVMYSGPVWSTFSIFHEKKHYRFLLHLFLRQNDQKFNILKNAKNCKLQINQKFNLLKNAKNQKSQKETKINTIKNY